MGVDIQDEVFRAYAFWTSVLIFKVMAMSFMTARFRIRNQSFANPEDAAIGGKKNLKVVSGDEDVERVRRAHLNDLENVVPFLIIGLLYTFTNPPVALAQLLFKAYTGARIAHTIVYAVYPVRQPARGIAFFVGVGIQAYMGFKVMTYFW